MSSPRWLLVLLPRRLALIYFFVLIVLFCVQYIFVSTPERHGHVGRDDQENARLARRTKGGPMPLLLHLDLKGAPPKLTYLEEFLPFARSLGFSVLLVEYEDTFPFHGRLGVLRSSAFFYTKEDIQRLLELAASLGMDVIPLVQTFGHMEFVLKHVAFKGVREQPSIDWSLCPMNNDSMALLAELIDQIMTLHPSAKYIHIGMDEVWNMGRCSTCQKFVVSNSQESLFVKHLLAVTTYIQRRWPAVRPIIWDDMLRNWSAEALHRIAPYADVMAWAYLDDVSVRIKPPLLARFSSVFQRVWLASSFKGSSGQGISHVPIQHHINNHLSWLEIIEGAGSPRNIAGMVLTGWSRFSHHRRLCELLPAGVPSLTLCAAIMNNRGFTHSVHESASRMLGFHGLFPIENDEPVKEFAGLSFPGHAVFSLVERRQAARLLKLSIQQLEGKKRRQAVKKLFGMLDQIMNTAEETLGGVYPSAVVNEWINHKLLGMWSWTKQELGGTESVTV